MQVHFQAVRVQSSVKQKEGGGASVRRGRCSRFPGFGGGAGPADRTVAETGLGAFCCCLLPPSAVFPAFPSEPFPPASHHFSPVPALVLQPSVLPGPSPAAPPCRKHCPAGSAEGPSCSPCTSTPVVLGPCGSAGSACMRAGLR